MKNNFFLDKKAIDKRQARFAETDLPKEHISHKIINHLLDRLDIIKIKPKHILLIGWQLSDVEKKLNQRYPLAKTFKAFGCDAIHAFDNNHFDLVIAHGALLREREPMHLLQEIHRVLIEEGLFLFTTLGPDTLYELNNSFLSVDQFFHVHPFTDMHDIGDWLRALHFSDPVMDREEITLAFDDLNLLFEDLKISGATNAHESRLRGLFTKNKWQKMLAAYEKYKIDDYYPATLEIIYGHGWKVKLPQKNTASSDEIVISVDSIKRRA